ncbi:hypothetical protein F4779DRAFT_59332 [Xylariaceae sp. FL0662B]|nr:hypothetical protein F4779DRAFT_59332 [Xylariaceae sp. FL0662B]
MYTKTSFAATLAALATTANSHMIMATPKPFGGDSLDNSPLTGQNYPCKVTSDPATFYSRDGIETTMAVGEKQSLSFKGSAVHGGGSCQLAVTKDKQPSASTSWQVILSIEGGCPSKSGSGPDTYDFTIPDSIQAGQYVFAWTWISKLAGQPEYYMNCAPITVTGGKAKREANETMELLTARDGALPELFVGNLATINDCKTEPSTDPEYPDPGPNVERPGSNNKFAKVTGSNCVPKGATGGSSSGDSGSSSGTPASGSADSSSSAAPASGSQSSTPASGSGDDGMYHPGPESGSGSGSGSSSGSSGAASSGVAAPSGFQTSVVATSAQPAQTSAAATQASSAAPAASSGAAGGSGSTTGGLTGACQAEGTFNCIGGTSYQQCASGSWSTVMQMPASVKCKEGQSMTLWKKDSSSLRKLGRRGY